MTDAIVHTTPDPDTDAPAPEISLIYPTPVLHQALPNTEAVNARLKAEILRRAGSSLSRGKSNVGGWHSEIDFFSWPHPDVPQLLRWVADAVNAMMRNLTGVQNVKNELDVWGWANVLYDSGYNLPHIHSESMWSGVYYVDPGTPRAPLENNGRIEFMDPRTAVDQVRMPGMPFTGRVNLEPSAGSLVLFPGWLCHFVNPYRGGMPRVAVAFNVRIVESNLPGFVSGGAVSYPLRPAAEGAPPTLPV